MAGDDFDRGLVEICAEQIRRLPRHRYDICAHAHGLGVDIDPDDFRLRHRHGRADDETGLCAGASRAMHDRGRLESRQRRLLRDLRDRGGIADCAQRVRDAVRHEIRFSSLPLEIVDQRSLNGTYVNGERVDRATLVNGAEVQIGKFRLNFFVSPVDLQQAPGR